MTRLPPPAPARPPAAASPPPTAGLRGLRSPRCLRGRALHTHTHPPPNPRHPPLSHPVTPIPGSPHPRALTRAAAAPARGRGRRRRGGREGGGWTGLVQKSQLKRKAGGDALGAGGGESRSSWAVPRVGNTRSCWGQRAAGTPQPPYGWAGGFGGKSPNINTRGRDQTSPGRQLGILIPLPLFLGVGRVSPGLWGPPAHPTALPPRAGRDTFPEHKLQLGFGGGCCMCRMGEREGEQEAAFGECFPGGH